MNEIRKEEYIDSDISPDSVQLSAGQKFHYQGDNGVIYFRLNVVEKPDGSLYPMTMTAHACNVLPIEVNEEGEIIAAYFLMQKGRPEMGVTSVALKATGAFLRVGESEDDGVLRTLKDRIGIEAVKKNLIFLGRSYGFGNQFQFPIDLFVVKDFTLTDTPLMEGCERVRMTISDIAVAQKDRIFFGSETIDLIATIMLRNANRGAYDW